MGFSQNLVFSIRIRHLLLISFFLLFTFFIQGRQISNPSAVLKEKEEKVVIERAIIGSRPPRCEGRCKSCGHCEAIQVPIVPQQGFPRYHFLHSTPLISSSYSRGDSLSNYKPMSWKCKCGDSIFNP